MTPFSNGSVFAVPNKTMHIQMILFSKDSFWVALVWCQITPSSVFNETQNLKQIHSKSVLTRKQSNGNRA